MAMNQNSNLETEIEQVRQLYAAINRNDIPAALKLFDPDIERIEPAGFPSAGTYRGHAGVGVHLSQGRGTWAEGSCEPERFQAVGDKIIAFLHVRVRLTNKSEWIDGRLADVFAFRNGKITQMRTFSNGDQALKWSKGREI